MRGGPKLCVPVEKSLTRTALTFSEALQNRKRPHAVRWRLLAARYSNPATHDLSARQTDTTY